MVSRVRGRLARARRAGARHVHALLSSLVGATLLASGSPAGTWAYFSLQAGVPANSVGSAKMFAPTDTAAVAQAAGKILVSWSDTSWATNGYSIRRSTSATGPFDASAEVGTTAAGVTSYTDTPPLNNTTYYYVVHGKSALGGSGLDSGVVSATTDSTVPTVSSTKPADQSSNNSDGYAITVNFSEPMNQAATAANFAVVPCNSNICTTPGTPVIGVLSWQSTTQLYFSPRVDLNPNTWYGIKLTGGSGGATDLAGNGLSTSGCVAGNVSGNTCYRVFRTNGTTKLTPSGVRVGSPGPGSTGIGTNTRVEMELSDSGPSSQEKTDAQNGFTLKLCNPTCGSAVAGSFSWSGGVMTFTPSSNLAANSTYTYTEFVDGTTSSSGTDISYTGSFTTGSGTDTTRPTVSQIVPSSSATGVNTDTNIVITFDGDMRPGTVENALTVKPWSTAGSCTGTLGSAISGQISWNSARTVQFDPTSSLSSNTCYQVGLTTASADIANNTLAATYSSNFTTVNGTAGTISLTNG